jgi:hypothetical protein
MAFLSQGTRNPDSAHLSARRIRRCHATCPGCGAVSHRVGFSGNRTQQHKSFGFARTVPPTTGDRRTHNWATTETPGSVPSRWWASSATAGVRGQGDGCAAEARDTSPVEWRRANLKKTGHPGVANSPSSIAVAGRASTPPGPSGQPRSGTDRKGDPKAALCVVSSWGYTARFHFRHPPTTPRATRTRRRVEGSGICCTPPSTADTNGSTSKPLTTWSSFMSASGWYGPLSSTPTNFL